MEVYSLLYLIILKLLSFHLVKWFLYFMRYFCCICKKCVTFLHLKHLNNAVNGCINYSSIRHWNCWTHFLLFQWTLYIRSKIIRFKVKDSMKTSPWRNSWLWFVCFHFRVRKLKRRSSFSRRSSSILLKETAICIMVGNALFLSLLNVHTWAETTLASHPVMQK